MADDIQLNSGAGGDVLAADDISGKKYQRVKLIHGADGVNAGDVSTANGLPIQAVAGSALIGKVGIDQTTPGTTNAVSQRAIISTANSSTANLTSQSVTSITHSGSTATVTKTAHGYSTNDTIHIIGADQSAYNDKHVITKLTNDTFSYSVVGSPTTPATGTITMSKCFVGTSEANTAGNLIQIEFYADQDVNIKLEQSIDGVSWIWSEDYEIPAGAANSQQHIAKGEYFRITLSLESTSDTSALNLHVFQLPFGQAVNRSDCTISTLYTEAGREVEFPSLDAFSRQRVSLPNELVNIQNQYDGQPLKLEPGATGVGVTPTWSSATRMYSLTVNTGGSGGTSFLQTFEYFPYHAGKSQLILATGCIGAAVSGAVVDWGYFDLSNGVFFRQNGVNGLQWCIRSSTSGSAVVRTADQVDWNIDRLDGSGPSQFTLDVTKVQILVVDLQYLGMGRVRCGFDIGGAIVWAHEWYNANTTLTVPYMQSGTLPVQMLVTAAAALGSARTAYFKCCSVATEGSLPDSFELTFATPLLSAVSISNGARTHVLSIRPKTTFNGITNRIKFDLKQAYYYVTGNNPIFWEVVIGQAITGGSWTDFNTTHSGYEYGLGTISGSPAAVLASGFMLNGNTSAVGNIDIGGSHFPITLDRAGAVRANGTLSFIATGVGGASGLRIATQHSEAR